MKPPSPIRIDGDTAYILLKAGFEAIIDVADVALVADKCWRLLATRDGHCYACTGQSAHGTFIMLHRFLLQPPRTLKVDHEDGNGLNNSRRNIRTATGTQNNANSVVSRRNLLGLKGVSRTKNRRFRAVIQLNDKNVHLGCFLTPEEASAAYKAAARVQWGEFAKK